ncbi:hypothetical protein C8R45DRAFT_412687 [Mycena sanguinolenta]|nr:hypothetical protein C8R45DRAFT_412687 [Mycena sanguinolenta]
MVIPPSPSALDCPRRHTCSGGEDAHAAFPPGLRPLVLPLYRGFMHRRHTNARPPATHRDAPVTPYHASRAAVLDRLCPLALRSGTHLDLVCPAPPPPPSPARPPPHPPRSGLVHRPSHRLCACVRHRPSPSRSSSRLDAAPTSPSTSPPSPAAHGKRPCLRASTASSPSSRPPLHTKALALSCPPCQTSQIHLLSSAWPPRNIAHFTTPPQQIGRRVRSTARTFDTICILLTGWQWVRLPSSESTDCLHPFWGDASNQ